MDYLQFVCFGCFILSSYGNYRKSSFSTRDISKCKTIYMCPTFCWTLQKGCFICKCDESTQKYMANAMSKMKEDNKPMKQTGSQFILDKLPDGRPKGPWSAMSNENSMFPGMGSLAGVYSFGGQTSLTDGTGNLNNGKEGHNIFKPKHSTSFHPYQPVPGQCPLMDYTCSSSCWYTDSMTGCITCACTDQHSVFATPDPIATMTTGPTSQFLHMITRHSSSTPPTTRDTYLNNKLLTTILGTTTATPVTSISLSIFGKSQVVRVCLPIETECPLHCLNYDHKTFCALCTCQSRTKFYEMNTIPPPTREKPTTLPPPTHEEPPIPTTFSSTRPSTVITTEGFANTCKPLSASCPEECKTYDRTTYCPVCRCETTTMPPTDGCVALPLDCPTKCVVLGDDGCPQCNCLSTTESSDVGAYATEASQCQPMKTDCPKTCMTYDPKDFCPMCVCSYSSRKSRPKR